MQIINKVSEMQSISRGLRAERKTIVLVPTMGYFHEGHASLMRRAKELGDIVITTLFVNPTQFAPNEDFTRYPRDIERDSKIASDSGVDYLFHPSPEEMYPFGINSKIIIGGITDKFEGVKRPGHFDGVATIVAKLFNATLPHISIFGQKDYQQTLVIKRLAEEFLFDIKIVVAPTIRNTDGLAMSSRNIYLSSFDRSNADILFRAIGEAEKAISNGEKRRKVINAIMHSTLRTVQGLQIDYASAADSDNLAEPEEFIPGQHIVLLIACYIGKTRLIDNAVVTLPSSISSKPENFIEG